MAFDDRIVRVTIEIGDTKKIYESPFTIVCNGMKYANPIQNECDIVIENLDKETRDYILTETSPVNINFSPKSVTVEAGRESYGTAVIYTGNIIASKVSQPPNIRLSLKALTANYYKGAMVTRTQAGTTSLEAISKMIANDLDVQLQFQATNKNIPKYNYSGDALGQVTRLNSFGGINAFIDNGILVVKDGATAISDTITVINKETGMVGIPEFTEQGLRVAFLLDNKTRLGGALRVKSDVYPACDGLYVIYKLGFQIASRDNPFYYIAECQYVGE